MKKSVILIFFIVLAMLSSCQRMRVAQVVQYAEEINQDCPFAVGDFATCVKVTNAEDTLVFKIQLLPHSIMVDEENSTAYQIDSLVSRPEDAKTFLGSIFFQPETEMLGKKKNADFDGLIDIGGSLRIDVVGEDSLSGTSVVFSSKEMGEQATLCLLRENVDSIAYEDILEYHKARGMLSVPQKYDERLLFVSVDYDQKSFNKHFQVVNYPLFFKLDDKTLHDSHVEMIEENVVVPFYMKSSYMNDLSALVEACAKTNRDLVSHYLSDKGQQRKVVITADELIQILQKDYVPPTMPEMNIVE